MNPYHTRMNERLTFQYPTSMAIDWAVRAVMAALFLGATAVYAISFTPVRGFLFLTALIIAIPTVSYGVYSLLLMSVLIILTDETISIRSRFHQRHIFYAHINSVQIKRRWILLHTDDGIVRIDGRLQGYSIFLHHLYQRSPQLPRVTPRIRLTISSIHLSKAIFLIFFMLAFGGGAVYLIIVQGIKGVNFILIFISLFMGAAGAVLLKKLLVTMLFSVTFTAEKIETHMLFHRRRYDPKQLLEIRLELVYDTVKQVKRSRRDLVFVFDNADDLRIQQGWMAQSYSDFLLLLNEMYAIVPTENKRVSAIPYQQFGSGSNRPFSAYFEQECNVQVENVQDIEKWLKGCVYQTDSEQFGKEDHWLHPVEFGKSRQGDCEDHALWAWRQLVNLGIKAEFVTGYYNGEGVNNKTTPPLYHAWVTFWQNGRPYLMETTSKTNITRPFASTIHTHHPRFSVDQTFTTFQYE